MSTLRRAALRGGATLALVLGVLVLARAEESPDGDLVTKPVKENTNWWTQSKGHWPPRPAPKPADKEAKPEKPVVLAPVIDVERERNAYFRRLAVCDKLKEVATLNNDQALLRQAEQLEQQVFEVYQLRTGMIGGKGSAADEKVLEEKLGSNRSDVTAPSGSNRNSSSRTASLREGQ
jgi:hypothetical protein